MSYNGNEDDHDAHSLLLRVSPKMIDAVKRGMYECDFTYTQLENRCGVRRKELSKLMNNKKKFLQLKSWNAIMFALRYDYRAAVLISNFKPLDEQKRD